MVGFDAGPQILDGDELERELNDPLAVELFRKDVFPASAEEVFAELDARLPPDHVIGAESEHIFLVGEGSQVAKDRSMGFNRNFRFLVTRGRGPDGPDLLISTFAPAGSDVEIMAWDEQNGGFNFYRTISGEPGSWVWAGNSRHAWQAGTRASGPFEAHPAGHFLFKEFRFPWNHWHGPPALIDELDFRADSQLPTHPWFSNDRLDGAYVLEPLALSAITRWNRRRIQRFRDDAALEDPRQFMERLLGSTVPQRVTVNLASSRTTQAELELGQVEKFGLPPTFFLNNGVLSEVLGFPGLPEFEVSTAAYQEVLAKFNVVVRNEDPDHPLSGESLERRGDTNFLFLVPEYAIEDADLVRQVVKPGAEESGLPLISERLLGCLLMVDFPNPVFSERRAQLLDHVESTPLPESSWASFSDGLGNRITEAGERAGASEGEKEFAALWTEDDAWKEPAGQALTAYRDALETRLQAAEGVEDVFRLAEARRRRFRQMPIAESPLLLAQSDLSFSEGIERLAMTRDAEIESR